MPRFTKSIQNWLSGHSAVPNTRRLVIAVILAILLAAALTGCSTGSVAEPKPVCEEHDPNGDGHAADTHDVCPPKDDGHDDGHDEH